MTWPSLGALDDDRHYLESLVDQTPGIDPWCSGPDWFLPAHEAFGPTVFDQAITPRLWSEPGIGAVVLGQATMADGRSIVAGLEPLWGFACPLLGPDLLRLGRLAVDQLSAIGDWDLLVLGGLPLSQDLARELAQPFASLGEVQATYGIVRQVADLHRGRDAWFSARSGRFRKSLRQAERRATAVGLRFIDASDDDDVYERCVRIEQQSWKGQVDDGITGPGMHRFYEVMTRRLRAQGRFRATIAVLDGVDVGFIFGGVRNGRYRGLQLSFVESVRPLSVSHLLQHHTIQQLIDEDVGVYDMGMDMEYKRRWADRTEPSMSLIVHRPGIRARRRIG